MISNTRYVTAAILIAIAIIIGFLLSVPHTKDSGQKPAAAPLVSSTPSVSVHDVYKKGTHTLTGSLTASDACMAVTAGASLVGTASSSQSIAIAIQAPSDAGVCLQLSTALGFSTTLVAPANLPILVTVNGVAASTTIQ